MTITDLIQKFGNSANALGMTAGDKLQLINSICDALHIGGWTCHGHFDVTDEDVTNAWDAIEGNAGGPLSAYHVALLVATSWERECVVEVVS